jgi:hypothetical protein
VPNARCNLRKAERIWRTSKSVLHRAVFIKKKAELCKIISEAKKSHWQEFLKDIHSNPKQLWFNLNNSIGCTKGKTLL